MKGTCDFQFTLWIKEYDFLEDSIYKEEKGDIELQYVEFSLYEILQLH